MYHVPTIISLTMIIMIMNEVPVGNSSQNNGGGAVVDTHTFGEDFIGLLLEFLHFSFAVMTCTGEKKKNIPEREAY